MVERAKRKSDYIREGRGWRRLSTDELVERVETHADTWMMADEFRTRMPGGLGRWAV